MLPDRVSKPGPLTYESGVLPVALHGPAREGNKVFKSQSNREATWCRGGVLLTPMRPNDMPLRRHSDIMCPQRKYITFEVHLCT